jgi:hypothetical protein
MRHRNLHAKRSPGACTHCKKLKMKCDFGPGGSGSSGGSGGGCLFLFDVRGKRGALKGEVVFWQERQRKACACGTGNYPLLSVLQLNLSSSKIPCSPLHFIHDRSLTLVCIDPADNTCRRCRAGGHVCIVERRKPRKAPK